MIAQGEPGTPATAAASQNPVWKSILGGLAEGVVVFDSLGTVVLSNAAAGNMLGDALAEGRAGEVMPLARALEGDSISGVEFPAGGVRLSANLIPVREESGTVVGAVAVLRDITEQEQLRKFRRAVEQSPSSVVMTDLEGAINYVNPKFTEVTGYSFDEVLGKNPRILKTGHLPPEHYERMWRDLASGREWRGEFLNKKKNGEVYWEDASLCPIVGPSGAVTDYIAVKHDITGRKLIEEALRQANETLRLVIEASPVAMVTLDRDAHVTSWNRAAESTFGWSEREVIERPLPFVPPAEHEAFRASMVRVLVDRRVTGFEAEYLRQDGKTVEASVWQSPLSDAGGSVCGVLLVVADLSERRRVEERLRQVQKLDAIGTFASGLAHDFSKLLTMVIGFAQMFGSALPPGDRRFEQTRQIAESARKAVSLMGELLAFSGQQPVQPKVFSPNELIAGMEDRLRHQMQGNWETRVVLDPAAGCVRADPHQVAQAILKLVANAREAMPAGGTVAIATANAELAGPDLAGRADLKPGAYVMIAVRDTGRGISRDARQHLFEPFFTTKDLGRGRGLGLSTVYGTVKQASGMIRAASQPGQGAAFEIYLPRVDENQ